MEFKEKASSSPRTFQSRGVTKRSSNSYAEIRAPFTKQSGLPG